MINYSETVQAAMMDGVKSSIDAGGASDPGGMFLYTAVRPSPGGAITDQTLCVQIELAYPCGVISGGTLVLTTPLIDDNLPNSGTIAWGRIVNGAGIWVCDFDVGLAESDPVPELILSALVVYQGGLLKINNGVFNVG